ncbi:MAG: DUF4157 domain-containing protein [Treponema sp.]|jgi:hypothetical protein|nr:DUF4157 domain-containing protein [Treponema sp.]
MLLNIDFFADICEKTQIFHYLNQNKNYWKSQLFAKGGAIKGASVSTGKPEKKHPLEATVKNKLERELSSDLPEVMLHIGGGNPSILNTLAVYALTIGNDVYIREEAYKEGSVETDKILLHEMVHVRQNKNNIKIKSTDELNKAEAEAEQAEQEIYSDIWSEPVEVIEMDGVKIRFTQKQRKNFIEKVIDGIERWVKEQRVILDENEYLKLLCALDDFCYHSSFRTPKDPADKLLLEIEEGFRGRLC